MDTAAAIARVRAEEGALPLEERLFDDPFAHLFDGGPGGQQVIELFLRVPFFREAIRLRTRFIDDIVRQGLVAGLRQIVIVGAGFDCRALRMPEVGACGALVFEVDFPTQLASKRSTLEQAAVAIPDRVRFVGCDFADPSFEHALPRELAGRGFRRAAGTIFIWEGVAGYIDDGAADHTLRFMGSSAGPGSVLVFNYVTSRFEPNDLRRRLATAGFASLEIEHLDELHRRYLRREPPPGADLFRLAVARVAAAR